MTYSSPSLNNPCVGIVTQMIASLKSGGSSQGYNYSHAIARTGTVCRVALTAYIYADSKICKSVFGICSWKVTCIIISSVQRIISAAVCVCSELQYVLENSEAQAVLTTKQYASQMEPLANRANIEMHLLETIQAIGSKQQASQILTKLAEAAVTDSDEAQVQQYLDQHLSELAFCEEDGALIVYTSGTTGRPKGAVPSRWCRNKLT